jgi:GntR family transcriptional regulator/MocR family aminotransferase
VDRSKEHGDARAKNGTDFLTLRIDDAPFGAMSGWLVEQIRTAVRDGRLRAGDRLPASRTLATDLGVSRGVVTEAYRRLVDDGVVVTGGRGGTTIARTVPLLGPAPSVGPAHRRPPTGGPSGGRSSDGRSRADRPALPAVRTIADTGPGAFSFGPVGPVDSVDFADSPGSGDIVGALRAHPARYDLSPGLPDLTSFPRTDWLRAERLVLTTLSPRTFGYGDPAGAPPFRRSVAGWLARYRGIAADPEQIVIVAGVAQALALVCRVLGRHGPARIAVEDPGSLGARRQLEHWGMTTVAVPVDDQGLRVDRLRATGAPAVLVSPAHQFPMGVVLSGARRRDLLDWAGDGGLIIEDDYDAEHRYDRPPVTAVHAARPDRTCYAGSVSKILAPALRIGWLIPPPSLRDEVIAAKHEADLGNPVLAQLVLAELMDSGRLERHLRAIRRRHRRRRDAMISALRRQLPGATVHGAAAGLHLTVTFDHPPRRASDRPAGDADAAPADDLDLAARALAAGVKVQPLSWHRIRPGPPGLVLGYAACPAGQIEEAIAVLASVVDPPPG